MLNAHIDPRYFQFQSLLKKNADSEFVANTSAVISEQRLKLSRGAVNLFLKQLKHIVGTKKVYFILDSDRQNLYAREATAPNENYFEIMRTYFISSTINSGFEVVDMKPIFEYHYREHRLKFEFESDNHWNELGHRLAAQSLLLKMGM